MKQRGITQVLSLGAVLAMGTLYQTLVVKRGVTVKLFIYKSIHAPTLTYSHELWVMTETMRSQKNGQNEFLARLHSALHPILAGRMLAKKGVLVME